MNFPEWSDLGESADPLKSSWLARQMVYQRFRAYFDGSVFEQQVEGVPGEAPLLFPVGLNLVRMLCLAQADVVFGDWSDQVVKFGVGPEDAMSDAHRAAAKLLSRILRSSNANQMLWELDLDRQVYGGGVLKVEPALTRPGRVRWSRVPVTNFYPVWDPDDPNQLLEAYILTQMTHDQAVARYGYSGTSEIVERVEHWTRTSYTNTVDGHEASAFSGPNPWGFVPLIYVPRLRSSSWWGDSLTEELIPAQDELNMRIADLGESMNYNAHPVRWGYNLPREFNEKNFPLDPNSFWNLGRTLGNSPAPMVGLLEPKNPVPDGAFKYLNFLYDWTRVASFAPPIAFGDDNGGGQRSGDTLEIRLWPLVKATRRSRAYLGEAIAQAVWMSGRILEQKQFRDVDPAAIQTMLDGTLVPQFEPVLPRDHQAAVDEVVKLMSTTPPAISLGTAVKILGRGSQEVDNIRAELKDKELHPQEKPASDLREGLAGKMTPQVGA